MSLYLSHTPRLLGLLLAFPLFLGASTYYVDASMGSDTNTGLSPAQALKTIQKAATKPDVTVVKIAPGVYRETIAPGKNDITFEPVVVDPARPVVIAGTEKIAGRNWTPVPPSPANNYSTGRYTATLDVLPRRPELWGLNSAGVGPVDSQMTAQERSIYSQLSQNSYLTVAELENKTGLAYNIVVSVLDGLAVYKNRDFKYVLRKYSDGLVPQVFYNQQMMLEARFPNTPIMRKSERETLPDGSSGYKYTKVNGEDYLSFPIKLDAQKGTGTNIRLASGFASDVLDEAGYDALSATKPAMTGVLVVPDSLKNEITGLTGAKLHLNAGKLWVGQTFKIRNANDIDGKIYFDHGYGLTEYLPSPLTATLPASVFFVYGNKTLLDTEGEWFLENNQLELWTPGGARPVDFDERTSLDGVEIKRRSNAFDLSGKANITIKNITLFAATIISDDASKDCTLEGLKIWYASHFMDAGWSSGNDLDLQKKAPRYLDAGIVLRGQNHKLLRSTLAYAAGNGISIAGNGHRVEGNTINHINYSGGGGIGINTGGGEIDKGMWKTSAQNVIIRGNTIEYCGLTGINVTGLVQGVIDRNTISRIGLQGTDVSTIYAGRCNGGAANGTYDGGDLDPSQFTKITNNTIFDADWGAVDSGIVDNNAKGVYLDDGTRNFHVEGNFIRDVRMGIIMNQKRALDGFPAIADTANIILNNIALGNNFGFGWGSNSAIGPNPMTGGKIAGNLFVGSSTFGSSLTNALVDNLAGARSWADVFMNPDVTGNDAVNYQFVFGSPVTARVSTSVHAAAPASALWRAGGVAPSAVARWHDAVNWVGSVTPGAGARWLDLSAQTTGGANEVINVGSIIYNSLPVATNPAKWITGQQVRAYAIAGITDGNNVLLKNNTSYFIIRDSATAIRLASSSANATKGTAVVIKGSGTLTLASLVDTVKIDLPVEAEKIVLAGQPLSGSKQLIWNAEGMGSTGSLQLSGVNPSLYIYETGVTLDQRVPMIGTVDWSKVGAGTLILANNNTYTGETRLNGGVTQVATVATTADRPSSGLGAGAAALVFTGNATLTYTGVSDTTARPLRFSTPRGGDGTLNVLTAATLLRWTGPLTGDPASEFSSKLTLTGAGNGELAGVISEGQKPLSLKKDGTGTWTLSAVNHYTGSTEVVNGSLVITQPEALSHNQLRLYSKSTVVNGVTQVAGGKLALSFNGDVHVNTLNVVYTDPIVSGSVINNTLQTPSSAENTNKWSTGQPVKVTAIDATIVGLVKNSVYYIIRVGSASIQLASSSENAVAGIALVVTGNGSVTLETDKKFAPGIYTSASHPALISGNGRLCVGQNQIVGITDQLFNLLEDAGAQVLTLAAVDSDNDALVYRMLRGPSLGYAEITSDHILTYTPAANVFGTDELICTVTDARGATLPVRVFITIQAVNDLPVLVVPPASGDLPECRAQSFTLGATDVDGGLFTYRIVQQPRRGTVEIRDGSVIYTPVAYFNGADEFQVVVSDGLADSLPMTFSVKVSPVNDRPVAFALEPVTLWEGGRISLLLTGTDVDGDTLTTVITQAPAKGTVVQANAPERWDYVATPGQVGADTLRFAVRDAALTSEEVTVQLRIRPVNFSSTATTGAFSAAALWTPVGEAPQVGGYAGYRLNFNPAVAALLTNDLGAHASASFAFNELQFSGAATTLSGAAWQAATNTAGDTPALVVDTASPVLLNTPIIVPTGATLALTGAGTGPLTLAGGLSGVGKITKTFSGKLTLPVANPGFSGGLTATLGTVELGQSNAAGTGTITLASTKSAAADAAQFVTLNLRSASGLLTLANPLVVDQTLGRNSLTATLGSHVLSGPLTILGGSILTVSQQDPAGSLRITGPVNGDGAVVLSLRTGGGELSGTIALSHASSRLDVNTSSATTVWTLSGTGNQWGRTEILGAGGLRLGATNALSTSALLTDGNSVTSTGGLDLAGFNQTLGGLRSDSSVSSTKVFNSSATRDATLTLNAPVAAPAPVFRGQLRDRLDNPATPVRRLALTLSSGSQTLAGTNTYTGNTTLAAGTTLTLADTGQLTVRVVNPGGTTTSTQISGAGFLAFNGRLALDTTAVTVTSGTWPLIVLSPATNATYATTFVVGGSSGEIWTKVNASSWTRSEGKRRWTFNTAGVHAGKLTLTTVP